MTDRYEEFKKYIQENGFGFLKTSSINKDPHYIKNIDTLTVECICFENIEVFEQFEQEQAKKETEKEIKQIISRRIYCADYYQLPIGKQEKVSNIYDEIKEKDLIK